MSARVLIAVFGVLLVPVLVGCQSPGADGPVVNESPTSEHTNPEPTTPEESLEPDSPVLQLVNCNDGDRVGMENTITSQTAAFGEGDFERAYSYASPSFQDAVSIDAFSALIATSYGPLTTSADLRFGQCLVDSESGMGTIDARFTQGGVDVLGLRYTMQDTPEGWRVDGASALEIVGGGA